MAWFPRRRLRSYAASGVMPQRCAFSPGVTAWCRNGPFLDGGFHGSLPLRIRWEARLLHPSKHTQHLLRLEAQGSSEPAPWALGTKRRPCLKSTDTSGTASGPRKAGGRARTGSLCGACWEIPGTQHSALSRPRWDPPWDLSPAPTALGRRPARRPYNWAAAAQGPGATLLPSPRSAQRSTSDKGRPRDSGAPRKRDRQCRCQPRKRELGGTDQNRRDYLLAQVTDPRGINDSY